MLLVGVFLPGVVVVVVLERVNVRVLRIGVGVRRV